jgi:hypothetical protein
VDDKNREIYKQVATAEKAMRQMEQGQYARKLMLRGVAVMLSVINFMLVLRLFFK